MIPLLMICVFAGCSAKGAAPPAISPEQRAAIKQNLVKAEARVTSDSPDGLFLSLRNTYVEVRELGGAVDGSMRTQRDIQDFSLISEHIAKVFLQPAELADFKQKLRQGISQGSNTSLRAEYGPVTFNITRVPLRIVFLQGPSSERR